MAANVTCHIPGISEKSYIISNGASELIEKVRATGKPDGVIWIEYFAADGEILAQVHFIPTDELTEEMRSRQPNLAQRF